MGLALEMGEGGEEGEAAAALHERLVSYVRAASGGPRAARCGVWVEHSYARAGGGAAPAASASAVRVLLAPAPPPTDEHVDVEEATSPGALCELPADEPSDEDEAAWPEGEEAEAEEGEWERRVEALAPSGAHAELATRAAALLRGLRLARLAAPRQGRAARASHTRRAAIRLRWLLAPLWCGAGGGGAAGGGAGAWLLGALNAYAPREERALLDEVVRELQRAAPRLRARLPAPSARAPRADPLARTGPAVSAEGSERAPWLVWVCGGAARDTERWTRRLRALAHTRVVRPAGAGGAAPDAWCAALVQSARTQLADILAEAGRRAVVACGAGAGAALCAALAGRCAPAGGGGALRGVALLAPPLLTAEGARDVPDDPLHEVRLPMLMVAGMGGAACWRGAALEVCAEGGGGAGARRLVTVEGADDALRLPAARRPHVPQHALDAAVAEEVWRWASELADAAEDTDDTDAEAPAPRPPARAAPPPRAARASAPAPTADEDSPPPPHTPRHSHGGGGGGGVVGGGRAIEIVEGRVVSRVSGSTPLALLPPRRGAPTPSPAPTPAPAPPLGAADIMQLPIVFADDEPAPATREGGASGGGAPPVTVTSGPPPPAPALTARGGSALKYTRVIVAKRAGPPAPAAPPPPSPPAPAPARPARPVVLRRALRVVPRAAPARPPC